MSKRAIIYARVSTDEQADNFSIPTQLEAARRYAETHGFTIAHEFREDYSGLKLDRPELNKVRRLMAQGEIDAVIVYESSRLTRSKAHGPLLRDEFADAGVALHFVTRGKHENTLEAELLASTEDTFNWYWWAKMQEAMKRGRLGKANAGIYGGHGVAPPNPRPGGVLTTHYQMRFALRQPNPRDGARVERQVVGLNAVAEDGAVVRHM